MGENERVNTGGMEDVEKNIMGVVFWREYVSNSRVERQYDNMIIRERERQRERAHRHT